MKRLELLTQNEDARALQAQEEAKLRADLGKQARGLVTDNDLLFEGPATGIIFKTRQKYIIGYWGQDDVLIRQISDQGYNLALTPTEEIPILKYLLEEV